MADLASQYLEARDLWRTGLAQGRADVVEAAEAYFAEARRLLLRVIDIDYEGE